MPYFPLCCPLCNSDFSDNHCTNSKCEFDSFPIVSNVHVDCFTFGIFSIQSTDISRIPASHTPSKRLLSRRYISRITEFILGTSSLQKKPYDNLLHYVQPDSKILIIGGGTSQVFCTDFWNTLISRNCRICSTDIYLSPTVDVIADAHYLPFPASSFDLVIIHAVLEHVAYPDRVVGEIHRVLSPHGLVLVDVPFLQPFHEEPFDFSRFTISGLRLLFRRFSVLYLNSSNGPFHSLLLQSYTILVSLKLRPLAILFRLMLSRLCIFLDSLLSGTTLLFSSSSFAMIFKKDEHSPPMTSSLIRSFWDSLNP